MIFILINIFNIVQRNPEWVKYKDKGLKHCFDLDELHMDIVAIGRRAWASKSGVPFEILENAISEEVGNNDRHEDTPELENMTSNLDQRGTLPMISTRKRARAARGLALKDGKRLSAASALNKIINRLINVVESHSMTTSFTHDPSGCSILEVANLLSTLSRVEYQSDLFLLGTQLFLHHEC